VTDVHGRSDGLAADPIPFCSVPSAVNRRHLAGPRVLFTASELRATAALRIVRIVADSLGVDAEVLTLMYGRRSSLPRDYVGAR
jgi:hypothetical protein